MLGGNGGRGFPRETPRVMEGSEHTGRVLGGCAHGNWNPDRRQSKLNWNDVSNRNPKLGARPAVVADSFVIARESSDRSNLQQIERPEIASLRSK